MDLNYVVIIIANNFLTGIIPTFAWELPSSEDFEDCFIFPNPFNRVFGKFNFKRFIKETEDLRLNNLITLNLGKRTSLQSESFSA